MKTTKAAARAFLNSRYPETSSKPLDSAICEARRLYSVDQQYWSIVNRSHAGEDEAYDREVSQ